MFLRLALSLRNQVVQTARLARDMWNSTNLNDVWERELRNWEDIVQEIYYGSINRSNHCQQL